jgi:coproporphyrinogen III oxidase-like Fe-S oxidoreductase
MVRSGKRPIADVELLSEQTRAVERLMLGLRTAEGVETASVHCNAHCDEYIDLLRSRHLAAYRGKKLVLTSRGMFRSNVIISDLLDMTT